MERRHGISGGYDPGGTVSKRSPQTNAAKSKTKTKTKAKAKQAAKAKWLTLEFAGICSLVMKKGATAAEVWLPDVMTAAPPDQATKHFASLILLSEEEQKGVVADSAVTIPNHGPEYTVWNLAETTVSFVTDMKTGIAAPSKIAGPNGGGIQDLADIWAVSKPASFESKPPNACTVTIDNGQLGSVLPPLAAGIKYVFHSGDKPNKTDLKSARAYAWRIRVRIPFKAELSVVITPKSGKAKVLKFERPTQAVIANLCQEVGSQRNHFYAYYGLVKDETPKNITKLSLKKAKKGSSKGEYYPNWEYCFTSRITEV
jgi:hypothetical protein